jgi:hypothetical protein
MFPRLREQIGTALDLFVEFSTLGEYRLAGVGSGASSAPAVAPGQQAPQLGGASAEAPRAAVRRTVAGGATGMVPVATPAARRLRRATAHRAPIAAARAASARVAPGHVSSARSASARRTRVRGGAPAAPEQLCFAV